MQVLADHTLVIKTRHPARIIETIPKSKIVNNYGDGRYEVAVRWGLNEAMTLSKLNVKNVPSTIKRDYKWPRPMGMNPFDHQTVSLAFPAISLGAMPAQAGASAAGLDPEAAARALAEQTASAWNLSGRMAYDEIIDPRDLRNALLQGLRLCVDRPLAPRNNEGILP